MDQQSTNPSKFKVLIVGAGLGGLTMAILLEKASIDYEIYERSTAPKPLGSATSLGSNIMPLLEQLGLLEGLKEISKPVKTYTIYKEAEDKQGLDTIGGSDVSFYET
ncbi:hypothetical protein BGX27_008629, partial [Mortierella sp. AM989]